MVLATVAEAPRPVRPRAIRQGGRVDALGKRDRLLPWAVHQLLRARAFCNATGTMLVIQYREMQKAIRFAQNRVREVDRIACIAAMQVAA